MVDLPSPVDASRMTGNQKWVAAGIAIFVLGLGVVWTLWLWVVARQAGFADHAWPQGELPWVWSVAIWFMKRGPAITGIFALLLTVVSIGIGAAGEIYRSKREIVLVVLACLAGIAASVLAMIELDQPDKLATVVWFSDLADSEATSAIAWLFGGLIGWFGLFLASQLGISVVSPRGVLRRVTGGRSAGSATNEANRSDAPGASSHPGAPPE